MWRPFQAIFVQLSDSLSKLQIGKLVTDLEGTLNQVNDILQKVEKGNGTVSKTPYRSQAIQQPPDSYLRTWFAYGGHTPQS